MRGIKLIVILICGLPALAHAQGVGSECVPDIKRFCLDQEPGRGRINCLIKNKDRLSNPCKKFVKELSR